MLVRLSKRVAIVSSEFLRKEGLTQASVPRWGMMFQRAVFLTFGNASVTGIDVTEKTSCVATRHGEMPILTRFVLGLKHGLNGILKHGERSQKDTANETRRLIMKDLFMLSIVSLGTSQIRMIDLLHFRLTHEIWGIGGVAPDVNF